MRADPKAVLKLRCLFIKMRSLLELPLLRISQASLPDLYQVGSHFSCTCPHLYLQ